MRCTKGFFLAIYFLGCSTVLGQPPARPDFNSTEKIRVTPSAQAEKAGSAVRWLSSFDEARRKSTETGKPIFWYVPTIRDSFMDRTVELDRYMKAGMFSWPRIIRQLNDDFIPLKAVPEPEQSRVFDLLPFKFVEPGFLVVDSAGKSTLRCNRLTTQHPMWLEALLASAPGREKRQVMSRPVNDSPLGMAWTLFGNAQYGQCLGFFKMMKTTDVQFSQNPSAEAGLLNGMCRFRMGDQIEAIKIWQETARQHPDDPLAWKAAAEAEGLGPFVRGMEVHRHLPAAAYDKVDFAAITSSAPASTYETRELWRRGTHFLLGMQRTDGGFVDCDYDFGGTDSLPNVHVAITAICGMALLESDVRNVKVQQRQRHNAAELARAFVLDEKNWNFNDSDELFWAHVYRVKFLAASIDQGWNGNTELQRAVQGLASMQSQSGSWYHEYPNPLVTSLALIALKDAQSAGAKIDPMIIKKAVASLQRNRGRGGFFYSDITAAPAHTKAQDLTDASAARLPLCELALHQWGVSEDRRLADAVRVSFDKQSHLLASLKYDDHTSRHDYGGFFFWFDIQGRSEAILKLEDSPFKTNSKQDLKELILTLPEIDGCFVDSHEIGRCYGTAMALLTLSNLLDLSN